jgi:hypothetical protein
VKAGKKKFYAGFHVTWRSRFSSAASSSAFLNRKGEEKKG